MNRCIEENNYRDNYSMADAIGQYTSDGNIWRTETKIESYHRIRSTAWCFRFKGALYICGNNRNSNASPNARVCTRHIEASTHRVVILFMTISVYTCPNCIVVHANYDQITVSLLGKKKKLLLVVRYLKSDK